jgi:hypothetical protein
MIHISNREIINAVAGNIYSMHPYHLPEGIDKIMGHLVKIMDETPDSCGVINNTFKLFKFQDFTEFRNWLKNILEQVSEYKQLNVSKALKEKGVKYDDPENEGFRFTSRYTQETLDDRYTDFIDLDALIGNICIHIDRLQQMGDDCFLCKYAKEYGSTKPSECDKCLNCLCHPNIRYNRESHPMSLKPFDQWTEEEKEKYSLS